MKGKINEYKKLKQIATSGNREVWKVESVNRQNYAIKSISVTKDNKDEIKTEASLHISLEHPNILKAREFFFYNKEESFAIVLQYCSQGDLSLKIGQLPIADRHKIMKEIVEGLVYLHEEKNIVHRDLKPENILIMNGSPKISDLRTAKSMKLLGLSSNICALTYIAPEMLNGQINSDLCDIWSLGLIFTELLVGERIVNLVEGMVPALINQFSQNSLFDRIQQREYLPLLNKMLQKDPFDRLTAVQILEMLNNIQISIKFENKQSNPVQKLANIDEQKLIQIFSLDNYFPNLKTIQLHQMGITDQGLKVIAENAFKFPYLEKLWLPWNKITGRGMIEFANHGDYFKKLKELFVYQNQITDSGMIAFIQNGDKFKNLEVIEFYNNKITQGTLKVMAQSWHKFQKLKRIGLKYNQIKFEELKQFAKNGRRFPSLEQVSINSSKVSDIHRQALQRRSNLNHKISLHQFGDRRKYE